jgi:hypothetical protein
MGGDRMVSCFVMLLELFVATVPTQSIISKLNKHNQLLAVALTLVYYIKIQLSSNKTKSFLKLRKMLLFSPLQ